MTRWTKAVVATVGVVLGLVVAAGAAAAEEPQSGTLTWQVGPGY
ncbi:hypothetical protein [Amycolatopsis sp. NBC_01480]|jgi:hypothetical protein|nr:hypothetical protein [Amycolatopsis sp. NBC_01480]